MTTKPFKFTRVDVAAVLILILASLILLVDTIIYSNQPANMDGLTHTVNIAMFHAALSDGDFPVRWTDGFANYGLPMGSFAQQITSYLGGVLTFLTGNVIVSLNIIYILATIVSIILFYIFLRLYFKAWPSFVGAFIFNFAPYRIINLYIRGAVPEYVSSIFLIAILIFIHCYFKYKNWWSFFGLSFSVFGLILSHPMNVITGAFFIGPYLLFKLWQEKSKLKTFLFLSSSFILGLLLSSYYIVPLLKDIQYFYYGSGSNHYMPGSTLDFKSFFDPSWYYFITQRNEILSRGHFIKTGLIESVIFIIGFLFVIKRRIKKEKIDLLDICVVAGLTTLFLTTIYAEKIYLTIDFLSNIQFPWRMLSTFIIVPPIILAFFLNKYLNKILGIVVGLSIVFLIAWTRFPQLYYKNLANYPQDYYYFTVDNLHTQNMNPVWTGSSKDYEVHKHSKVAILEGEAQLSDVVVENSKRRYKIKSNDKVRMIDYTFYYPGWNVLVNGVDVPIEFQDVNYRGVITYWIPPGNHEVEVVFKNTKTVLLGNFLSIFSFLIICSSVLWRKKFFRFAKQ